MAGRTALEARRLAAADFTGAAEEKNRIIPRITQVRPTRSIGGTRYHLARDLKPSCSKMSGARKLPSRPPQLVGPTVRMRDLGWAPRPDGDYSQLAVDPQLVSAPWDLPGQDQQDHDQALLRLGRQKRGTWEGICNEMEALFPRASFSALRLSQRYRRVLRRNTAPFTPEEDEALGRLFTAHPHAFAKIGAVLGRTDCQVRTRLRSLKLLGK
ncbi:hypothetical protein SS50377_25004 [Spironucleus salmonicida]|uniref:HTH myb-type domain-containing protein n=1 Tax=Spironucleus salmonicida TaxID=348837 RepID=A0A9P8LRI5_9EUKA|nr:hypothetical protein SS50377_25004 [Spironucleus salmonicida]